MAAGEFECRYCGVHVDESDDFCPTCGTLFSEHVFCKNHSNEKAVAVCIICCEPFCSLCVSESNKRFLCTLHSGYEIYEGMARVFGCSDAVNVEYAKSCLHQAGLHPFVFTRKASTWSIGGPDYSLFCASGEYDGHIINEFKLMVPCREVPKAEELLEKLEFANSK